MILTENNYVEKAEKAIMELKNKKDKRTEKPVDMVTTSKIRNLLAMTADIYNEVLNTQEEQLSAQVCGRIDYLKVRVVYEAGREKTVKSFVNETQIIQCINEIQGSRKNYILFNRYMEALVAYHRFLGGKDN